MYHSTLSNGEFQFSTQVRLADNFAAAQSLTHCPRHNDTPHTHGGWHFITGCKSAQVGVLEHKAVQEVIHCSFKQYTYAVMKEVRQGPDRSSNNRHTDLLISVFGQTPVYIDISTTCPMGITNQRLINRRPAPSSPSSSSSLIIDHRERTLVAATQREAEKVSKHEATCLQNNSTFLPFVVETSGGFGHRTRELEQIYRNAIDLRRSEDDLPTDLLIKKFRKDIAFALRKGTYATVSGAVQRFSAAVTRSWRSMLLHSNDMSLRWLHADVRFPDL
jgi:hypothetical protein